MTFSTFRGPLLASLLIFSPALFAEEKAAAPAPDMQAMMAAFQQAATPGDEHATLAKGAGTWKATVTSWPSPGAPPMTSEGVFERQLILGGRVMEESYKGDVMGMPFEGHSMLGFDNVTRRWWTMWVDNMSTGPMVLWGAWDESEKAVVYEGTTPDPMSGQLIPMKTVVRHPSADEEQMTMFDLRTGEPVKTMEIIAKRQ